MDDPERLLRPHHVPHVDQRLGLCESRDRRRGHPVRDVVRIRDA